MNHNIKAVVLYSSIEKRFLMPCVTNLLLAGLSVHIICYDHLYGGEKELEFLPPDWETNRVRISYLPWMPCKSSLFHEAYARYFATRHWKIFEYNLYIDSDEIVEPYTFKIWLDSMVYIKYKSLKLAQYLYCISPKYRLNLKAYNTVLCNGNYARSLPFTVEARFNAYWNNKNEFSRWAGKLGLNRDFGYYRGKPFIHHYTNVRSPEEMFKKVANYSHNKDKPNLKELANKMFIEADSKQIGGQRYTVVENVFNIKEDDLYKIV